MSHCWGPVSSQETVKAKRPHAGPVEIGDWQDNVMPLITRAGTDGAVVACSPARVHIGCRVSVRYT